MGLRPDQIDTVAARPVFASVSGGKDSTAMVLALRDSGIPYTAVFADTGWEHPDTYAYIQDVLDPVVGPIHVVRSDEGGMADLVRRKAMFPSRVRRFCTDELKVKPIAAFITAAASGLRAVNAVGIRAAESAARAVLAEWEPWPARGVDADTWRPILRWSEADVIEIHRRHGLRPNPLYLRGALRVGCWPCIHARKAEIAMLARESPWRIDEIRAMEAETTEAARTKARARALRPAPEHSDPELNAVESELRDPESPRHVRTFFAPGERGATGAYGIDAHVEWSTTARGGRQLQLFDDSARDAMDGCMRWGMCDAGPEEGA